MAQTGNNTPDISQLSVDRRLKYLDREMARHSYHQSGLLEVLFKANGMFGFLPDDILRYISTSLKVAPSRVFAAATFYTRFSLQYEPVSDVHVCQGVTCLMNGSAQLAASLTGPGPQPAGTRCSGLCSHGPVAYVHGRAVLHADAGTVQRALQQHEGDAA